MFVAQSLTIIIQTEVSVAIAREKKYVQALVYIILLHVGKLKLITAVIRCARSSLTIQLILHDNACGIISIKK